MRGSPFREGKHDLILQRGGMVVFPRLIAVDHETPFVHECVPSGITALDALMGGGLDRGTSTMFMGPPGTGKSTLSLRFAAAAAERGEKSLLFLFDETPAMLVARAKSLGVDVEPYRACGLIELRAVDPAAISPGELSQNIVHAVMENGVKLVAIDSINGYLNAMPEARFLTLQLHELLTFLSRQGIITLLVLSQQGLVGTMSASVDLSYLADSVVLSRYFEARGAVKLALSVIKKRSGSHERTIREYRFAEGGVELGEPLTDMQGVLTGIPTFVLGTGTLLPPAEAT